MSDYKTTYPPVTQPEHLRPNDLYVREFQQGVTIPMTQNLFGGIGAFIVTAIIGWKAGMATEDFAALGLVIGGLLFGGSCVVRAFRDEVRFMLNAYGERQDKATRQALQAEVEQLRREMKELRSAGIITARYQALMGAERLLQDHFERGEKLNREPAMRRGYSRDLWDSALKILRTAGVVNSRSEPLVTTYAEAWAKVLRSQSTGMGSFVVTEAGDVVRTK